MENITKIKTPIASLMFLKKKQFLLKIRRLMFLMATMFLIGSIIEFVSKGLVVETLLGFGISSLMFNFANRCDNLLLRIKIEDSILNVLYPEEKK